MRNTLPYMHIVEPHEESLRAMPLLEARLAKRDALVEWLAVLLLAACVVGWWWIA